MNYNRDRGSQRAMATVKHLATLWHSRRRRRLQLVSRRRRRRRSATSSRRTQQLITVAETIFMAFTRSVDRTDKGEGALSSRGLHRVDTSHTHTLRQAHKLFCYAAGQSADVASFVFSLVFCSALFLLLLLYTLLSIGFTVGSIIIWRVPLCLPL